MAVLLCFETGSPGLELTVRGCATTPSPWLTHNAKCIQSNFHRLSSLNSPNIVQKSKDTSGWWSLQAMGGGAAPNLPTFHFLPQSASCSIEVSACRAGALLVF